MWSSNIPLLSETQCAPISTSMQSGQTVGIIGGTGSAKTTLVQLTVMT